MGDIPASKDLGVRVGVVEDLLGVSGGVVGEGLLPKVTDWDEVDGRNSCLVGVLGDPVDPSALNPSVADLFASRDPKMTG
jgi:hypothetical protein